MTREEAIDRIKDMHSHMLFAEDREAIETLIPELRESEDERVIRTLFFLCKDHDWFNGATKEECLNWLEKQKGQKHPNGCFTCDEYKKGYEAGRLNGFTAGYNKAIKEQKPAEWSEKDKGILLSIKCVIDSVWHNFDYDCSKEELKEMWNWLDTLWQIVEYLQPKQEWSKEDEEMRKLLIAIFEVNHPNGFFKANEINTTDMRGVHTEEIVSWLKSLPLNLKKKNEDVAKLCSNEWSEEDEKMINTIVSVLGQYIDYKTVSGTGSGYATPRYNKEIDWLKSLRPSWRPSEEQMEALRVTLDFMPDTFKPRCTLMTLQNDLEKLM